eukprot:CAMPEP_0183797340 /NCGR_PEP_ID=MMETSP0803_2-20130417/15412_1 /TAXON_ID=195967 /ORGANISM="Crustomastix stigmata, Strain CCMP3273" /LENGTH=410 /DNA_ID=CAMNT_0026042009 /DNA_START=52 /DNA_END=1284 /DNA_ORIENTATION=-
MEGMEEQAGGKRNFKEKLLDQLSAAEAEAAKAAEEPVKSKQSLLVEMLVEGHPAAFVDMFYLTHRDGVADDTPTPAELEARGIDPETFVPEEEVAPESLQFLKEQLVLADDAARKSQMREVFDAYMRLARYFEGADNHRKAIFFYEKCLKTAQSAGDSDGELEANLHMGGACEHVGDTEKAAEYHEKHHALALQCGDDDALSTAQQNLVQVYRRRADELEEAGELGAAVSSLDKCLAVAKQSTDTTAEGLANYRLGQAYEKLGDYQRALQYHQDYRRLCTLSGDKTGEGTACCALASTHQALGDTEAAISNLETFLELAKNGDPASQARACCSLGIIYMKQKKFERAVTYFEKFFEVARSLHDRRMLDVARVNLGIARGSVRTGRLMDIVASDAHTLLQWKNVRMPLGVS